MAANLTFGGGFFNFGFQVGAKLRATQCSAHGRGGVSSPMYMLQQVHLIALPCPDSNRWEMRL